MEEAEEDDRNDHIPSVPELKELCRKMQDIVAGAVSEYDALSAQVINHIYLMQKMPELNITDNDDAALNEMFLAAQSKSEKTKFVESEEKEALLAITKVMDNKKHQIVQSLF